MIPELDMRYLVKRIWMPCSWIYKLYTNGQPTITCNLTKKILSSSSRELWRPVDLCLHITHLILVLISSSKPTFVTWALLWAVMRYLHSQLQKRSHLRSSKLDGSYTPSKPVTRNPWWHYENHWSSVNMTIVATFLLPQASMPSGTQGGGGGSPQSIHKILWKGTEHSPGIFCYSWTSDFQFAA